MPLPSGLARFNRVFSNKLMRPLARVAPGFGVLQHRGRKSAQDYETPLNAFRDGDRVIVALTYGEEVDWLRNARASMDTHFLIRGRPVRVGPPVDIPAEDGLAVMPAPMTAMLSILNVTAFVAFPIID